jgi:chromosome segregation ATPase
MSDVPLTLAVLAQFHREVILPDVKRVVEDAVGASERRLRDEMHAIFDSLDARMTRREQEYQLLVVGVRRVEERLERIEGRLEGVEERLAAVEVQLETQGVQIRDLQAAVFRLEERLSRVEKRLEDAAPPAGGDLRNEVAELRARLTRLEAQVRALGGQAGE